MSGAVHGISAAARAVHGGEAAPEERLREASREMEGVFVQHLTRALRATVPGGGNPDAPGAELYGSLLDEHLAVIVASDTRTGIAEALYRQLSGLAGLEAGGGAEATTSDEPHEGRRE